MLSIINLYYFKHIKQSKNNKPKMLSTFNKNRKFLFIHTVKEQINVGTFQQNLLK